MHERTLYLGCDSIEHRPGNKCVLESWFEETPYGIVFEDDGNTGYFYAAHTEQGILDALHIYNVKDVTDRDTPSTISLLWDETFDLAALEINGYIHAVFDFIAHAGYCRNAFPEADVFFPDVDWRLWREAERTDHAPDERNPYALTFATYLRR